MRYWHPEKLFTISSGLSGYGDEIAKVGGWIPMSRLRANAVKVGDVFTVAGTFLINEPTNHPHGTMPLSEKDRTLATCPVCSRCIYACLDDLKAAPVPVEYRESWQRFHNSGHGHYPACPGVYQWKE